MNPNNLKLNQQVVLKRTHNKHHIYEIKTVTQLKEISLLGTDILPIKLDSNIYGYNRRSRRFFNLVSDLNSKLLPLNKLTQTKVDQTNILRMQELTGLLDNNNYHFLLTGKIEWITHHFTNVNLVSNGFYPRKSEEIDSHENFSAIPLIKNNFGPK